MRLLLYFSLLCFLSSCHLLTTPSKQIDYALWADHNSNGQWTEITEKAINNSLLLQSQPKDIKNFCPQYESFNQKQKRQFWTYLISSMTLLESHFDTQTQYQEKFKDSSGSRVISRGLLQLSHESAKQKSYACDFDKAEQLHEAEINLTCGVNILSYWVKRDGVISGKTKQIKGGGRYWSVLRPANHKFKKIQEQLLKLAICSA